MPMRGTFPTELYDFDCIRTKQGLNLRYSRGPETIAEHALRRWLSDLVEGSLTLRDAKMESRFSATEATIRYGHEGVALLSSNLVMFR